MKHTEEKRGMIETQGGRGYESTHPAQQPAVVLLEHHVPPRENSELFVVEVSLEEGS